MNRRRRFLLSCAVLGMTACWLDVWAEMLEQATSAQVSIASGVIVLLLVAAGWHAALARMKLHPVAVLAAYWATWLPAASLTARMLLYRGSPWVSSQWLLALPRSPVSVFFEPDVPALLLFIGSAAAWHLAQRRAVHLPDYGRLLADFQFGLVMLLVAFLVSYGFEVEVSHPLLPAFLFFGIGITAIAIARSADTNDTTVSLSPGQLSGIVAAAVGAVFFTFLLIATIVRPEIIDSAINGLHYAGSLIGRALAYLASLVPAPDYGEIEAPGAPATGDDSALIEWYRSLPLPAIIRRLVYVLWVTIVLGVLLFALWRICEQVLQWLRKRRQPLEGAVVESSGSFWADLTALVARIAAMMRRTGSALLARLKTQGNASRRTGIDIYLQMIRWTDKKVLRRKPWQSPHEYLRSLVAFMPAAAQDLAFVTDSYVRERYGRRPVPEEVRTEMDVAVHRIRHTRLNRLKNLGEEN